VLDARRRSPAPVRSIREESTRCCWRQFVGALHPREEVGSKRFAEYCGTGHCIGVSSGTAAIALALEAVGVAEGDEVIAPANTFIASVLPVLRLGETGIVDCDEATATPM
jgi:dTDP-4-amino-4,6-dideoxygalactose transaminase